MMSLPILIQSVEVSPAHRPAASRMPAVIRTVVDLPLVPVTMATGIVPISCQGTSAGAGSWSGAQTRAVAP